MRGYSVYKDLSDVDIFCAVRVSLSVTLFTGRKDSYQFNKPKRIISDMRQVTGLSQPGVPFIYFPLPHWTSYLEIFSLAQKKETLHAPDSLELDT